MTRPYGDRILLDKLQFEASNKSIMIYRYYTPSRGFCQVGLCKYKKEAAEATSFLW